MCVDQYAIRRTGHGTNSTGNHDTGGLGNIKIIRHVLSDVLRPLFQDQIPVIRSTEMYLPPLDNEQFDELCTDVYSELLRRERHLLNDDGCYFSPSVSFQDEMRPERTGDSQRLSWLPKNLFDGLLRDVYLELRIRYPWLLSPRGKPRTHLRALSQDLKSYMSHDEDSQEEHEEWNATRLISFNGLLPMGGTRVLVHSPPPELPPALSLQSPFTESGAKPSHLRNSPFPNGISDDLDRPFNIRDALIYLDAIKYKFQNHPDIYNEFLMIKRAFKNKEVDVTVIIHCVSMLFAAYPELIEGFSLPPVYEIESFLRTGELEETITGNNYYAAVNNPRTPPPVYAVVENRTARSTTLPQPAEPFSKHSDLCLDGKITHSSEYAVASGGYADIRTGLYGTQTVAIKIMRAFSSLGAPIQRVKLRQRLWREYLAWSRLSHPNILECLGFSYDFTPHSGYEVPSLISPWMSSGTVLSHIERHPNVDRFELLVGIATGLSYLHSRKPTIVHGDLRAGNILVSDAGVPCLTDFGLSRILSDTRGMSTSSEPAGSVRWMSPELFRDDKASESSDVWAYGMTVLEIMSGKRPYNEFSLEPVVLRQLVDGKIPSRPTHTLTDELWELCQNCWRLRPIQRPSMREVMSELNEKQKT